MSREWGSKDGFCQPEGESLPVFFRQAGDLTLFYAPGYLAAAGPKEAAEILSILSGEIPFGNRTAHYLLQAALSAQDEWRRMHDADLYRPTCLMLYTSLACSLNCTYCFAEQHHDTGLQLSEELILHAAREVLANCAEKALPFTVVFHGGGEPSLDPRLPALLTELRTLSERERLPFVSYIATNGVMGPEKARWIAENFSGIGLSVDGPPDIQDPQRPLRSGCGSSGIVERTAAVFREIQGHLTVRVTVMPENFRRIPEIAAWCREKLGADEIRMEPVYHRGTDEDLAEEFCTYFLQASRAAEDPGSGGMSVEGGKSRRRTKLSCSTVRIHEIHGRYCQIFRQVLHLVPPAGRSACFLISSQTEARGKKLDRPADKAVFDRLAREDPACEHCFNRFHCARGCPDVCPASDDGFRDAGSFRCRVSRTLAEAELLRTAERLLFEPARKYGCAGIKIREG